MTRSGAHAPRVTAQLADGEQVRVAVNQHPMAMARPILRVCLGLALWIWVAFTVPAPGRLLDGATLLVIGLALWAAWEEVERRHNWIVVTDTRIFRTEGIFTRTVPMMRLSKVTDVTYRRGPVALVMGYGTIVIESAGQDQALHDLDFIPYPEGTDALKASLFGERPREREASVRRLGLPRRRHRGDDGPPPGAPGGGPGGGPGGPGASGRATPGAGHTPADRPDDDPDVPPAGQWQAHRKAQRSTPRRVGDGESLYRSRDLEPTSRREGDTGPIPLYPRDR